jgi:hypothetical protein
MGMGRFSSRASVGVLLADCSFFCDISTGISWQTAVFVKR